MAENEDHGIWSITSWQIDGETVETVTDFISLGSKITADGDCSNKILTNLGELIVESKKVGLKLNIQKMRIMASSPIPSWQIDGKTVETVDYFTLGGLQNHCRW